MIAGTVSASACPSTPVLLDGTREATPGAAGGGARGKAPADDVCKGESGGGKVGGEIGCGGDKGGGGETGGRGGVMGQGGGEGGQESTMLEADAIWKILPPLPEPLT